MILKSLLFVLVVWDNWGPILIIIFDWWRLIFIIVFNQWGPILIIIILSMRANIECNFYYWWGLILIFYWWGQILIIVWDRWKLILIVIVCIWRSNYRTHRLFHQSSDEWKHKCEICNKNFPQKVDRDRHYMIHTGMQKKLYICFSFNYFFWVRKINVKELHFTYPFILL